MTVEPPPGHADDSTQLLGRRGLTEIYISTTSATSSPQQVWLLKPNLQGFYLQEVDVKSFQISVRVQSLP